VTGLGVDLLTQDARQAQKTALDLVSNTIYKRQPNLTFNNVN
jgi:hypothetical protein